MTIQLTTPAHLRPSQHSDTHVIAFLGTGRMGARWPPTWLGPASRCGSGRFSPSAGGILADGGRAALTNDRPVANDQHELQETSLTVIDGFRVPAREG
jgi:hypothetical protein